MVSSTTHGFDGSPVSIGDMAQTDGSERRFHGIHDKGTAVVYLARILIITNNQFHLHSTTTTTLHYNSTLIYNNSALSTPQLNSTSIFIQKSHSTLLYSTTFTMAAFTLTFAPTTRSFGRSGYNKDGDDSDSKPTNNRGRSGYNDPEEGDSGRSGYNGPEDDDSSKGNKGRSGYNGPSDNDEE
ncbi:hypothetical protein FCIRC_7674 [Fusarium circinatum]|uniref:Uncharacterized protein n=2 Tax=Fusarium fujikuroi species complex TaxID=171627 RepID=A0A8H5TT24_FUSCI|nr:hypothetical protein FCIRC_7674 [Fusarium circinatum]